MNRPVATWIPIFVFAALGGVAPAAASDAASHLELTGDVTQGALRLADPEGELVECPLEHTDVQVEISGFIARVRVKQTFVNPLDEPIEAVYVFPLSHSGAVDEMTMVIGPRRIVGVIERRADARRIYERALARGATASLLEQERPNIFTQSVANIPPRGRVDIEIGYVDILDYESGGYEFRFPMVVGPRFIPGAPISATPVTPAELEGRVGEVESRPGARPSGTGWSPDTSRVPDAARITPRVLRPGTRTGHDVSLEVRLDAGVRVRGLVSTNHEVDTLTLDERRAHVKIAAADTLPNKDFVLRYGIAGARPEVGLLAHAPENGDGTFLLMLQPKQLDEELAAAPPREICFLIDVSGSMSGRPSAKVREIMERFFEEARPEDRIQVVTFASRAQRLFPGYVPASPTNVQRALNFTRSLRGGGGTQMLEGIRAALEDPADPQRVRIVMLLSDGYIGNEAEIIRVVRQRTGDRLRFWSLGIGSSPNQYLIDGVAAQGGGDSAVVGLGDDPRELVGRITDRIHRAQLADIRIDWGGLDVFETYPAQLPDLWAGEPVFVLGRFRGSGDTTIALRGRVEGRPASFEQRFDLPESENRHGSLTSAWARRKIADLEAKRIVFGARELVDDITELALEYRLMSAYTSFVAVDAETLGEPGPARRPRRMLVPVPLPAGTRFEGFFAGREVSEANEVLALASMADRRSFSKAKSRMAAATPLPRNPGKVSGLAGAMNAPVSVAPEADARRAAPGLPLPTTLDQQRRNRPLGAKVEEMERSGRIDRDHGAASVAAPFVERAQTASARRDWRLARRMLQLAYLLGGGDTLGQSWQDVERLSHQHAVAALPELGHKAGLEVRNQSLAEALAILGNAGRVKIRVEPGSEQDSLEALGRTELRVAYLGLQDATLAQALSWVLEDFGLEWDVIGRGVTVTSARRAPGTSAWAYSLDLAPSPQAAAQIVDAVRERLSAGDDISERHAAVVVGNNLVVRSNAAGHEQTARLLSSLADASAEIDPELAALQRLVSAHRVARAGARGLRAKSERASEAGRWSWQLIAATPAAAMNVEAVSVLRELARQTDRFAELGPDLQARVLFAIGVARAAHPEDGPLRELAELAFARPPAMGSDACGRVVAYLELLGRLPGSPTALRGVEPVRHDAHERELIEELLRPSGEVGRAAALLRAANAARDEDLLVLTGLSAARSGPAAWNDFRVELAEGGFPLSGAAVRALGSLEYVASLFPDSEAGARRSERREASPQRAASGRLASGGTAAIGVVAGAALLARRLR